MPNDAHALRLRPDIVVTVLDDSAVLLDLESKFFYSVNGSGWAVVQLLENGVPEAEVFDQCVALGAPPEGAAAIAAFVGYFREQGLVESVEASFTGEVEWHGGWVDPVVEKHREPLQKVMVSAFDPSLPLAE